MGNAIARFYYDFTDNKTGYKKLVSSVFNSILIRGFLLFGLGYLLKDNIGQLFSQPALQDFSQYGFASIIIGTNRAINLTAFALFRNEKKVRLYLILNFILGLFRAGFQLAGVFLYDMSFIGYIYGSCIGSSFTAISILVYVYYTCGFRINLRLLKQVNHFARPLFFYALVYWGIRFADRYFLESSPVELGIYSQALLLGMGIELILQGLQGASQPEIYRLLKNGISKSIQDIRKLSNLLMMQTQVVIGLAILPAMLYCLFFKTDLHLASGLVAVVFIRYIQRTQYVIISYPVYYSKKTKAILYLNILILAINLILLYYLVPILGPYGAIIAILVSQTFQVAGLHIYQQRIIPLQWNNRKILLFPNIIIGLTVVLEILKNLLSLDPFITSGITVCIIFVSLLVLYKNEVRNVIKKGWKQYL